MNKTNVIHLANKVMLIDSTGASSHEPHSSVVPALTKFAELIELEVNKSNLQTKESMTKYMSMLRDDLAIAAATLRRYETQHRLKGTSESLLKANVNAELATKFEATLAKTSHFNLAISAST